MKEWISVEGRPLHQDDGEVVAFHPKWIDKDYNPNGTRVGFVGPENEFISATWNNYQDTYENDEELMPTHYMFIPENPKKKPKRAEHEEITAQRLEHWKKRLSEINSTPQLVIAGGISGKNKGQLSLITIENLDDNQVTTILMHFLTKLNT